MNQSNDGFMKDRKEGESIQPLPRFGRILYKARRLRGLSQKQLAIDAKVDPGYVSRIENGHRNPPSPRVITRIAEALQISPEILMVAAGYLGSPDEEPSETAILNMVETALGYPLVQRETAQVPGALSSMALSLPIVPLIGKGDECMAVDANGKLIVGKAVLYVEIGAGAAEKHEVKCVLYRVS